MSIVKPAKVSMSRAYAIATPYLTKGNGKNGQQSVQMTAHTSTGVARQYFPEHITSSGLKVSPNFRLETLSPVQLC